MAAVGEPAGRVGGGDGSERGPGRRSEVVVRSGLGPAEVLFGLGECLLDGIEVGRMGRQREAVCAPRLDGRSDGRAAVGREVVGDHDLAGAEGGREHVADVALDAGRGHATVDAQSRSDPVEGQRRDDGLVLAPGDRRGRVRPLSAPRPGVGGARARWPPVSSTTTKSSGRTTATLPAKVRAKDNTPLEGPTPLWVQIAIEY
jgi:hypothetical protein